MASLTDQFWCKKFAVLSLFLVLEISSGHPGKVAPQIKTNHHHILQLQHLNSKDISPAKGENIRNRCRNWVRRK